MLQSYFRNIIWGVVHKYVEYQYTRNVLSCISSSVGLAIFLSTSKSAL